MLPVPIFGRSKPALVISVPGAGDLITFDWPEESAILERRARIADLVGDTLYDEETAREVVRSQDSLALLLVALYRLKVRDFHGAAAACVKTVAVWDSGVAWWVAAEVFRLYGDKRGAGRLVEKADQAAQRYGLFLSHARPYAVNYRKRELEAALKTGQEYLALSVVIKLELEAKVEYLRSLSKPVPPYATVAQWIESWHTVATDETKDP